MSKERATEPTPIAEKKTAAEPSRRIDMTSEQAAAMILAPYVTEKTFNQIEKEKQACFHCNRKGYQEPDH